MSYTKEIIISVIAAVIASMIVKQTEDITFIKKETVKL